MSGTLFTFARVRGTGPVMLVFLRTLVGFLAGRLVKAAERQ